MFIIGRDFSVQLTSETFWNLPKFSKLDRKRHYPQNAYKIDTEADRESVELFFKLLAHFDPACIDWIRKTELLGLCREFKCVDLRRKIEAAASTSRNLHNTAVTERLHDLEVIVCELQNEARETQATRLALESQMATSEILFTESQQTIQTLSDQVAHYSALCQSLSDTVTRLLLQVESLTNQVNVLAQNQPPLAAAYTDSSRTVSSVPCS